MTPSHEFRYHVNWLVYALMLAQLATWLRVVQRMLQTGGDAPVTHHRQRVDQTVTVLLPVLDEEDRLGACLDAVLTEGPEVMEILVVDGGSVDGTREVVTTYSRRDPRVRWVDASPVPADATGKAWGLIIGVEQARGDWVLMLDADVRIGRDLTRSLVAHAERRGLAALSVATRQELADPLQALLHPALLTTLVYRFGRPNTVSARVRAVQANGQCLLARRDLLIGSGALEAARQSLCEDFTIVRHLARQANVTGFHESEVPVTVRMYANAPDAWRNWTRSLPLRDQHAPRSSFAGLFEVLLVQALPAPLLIVLIAAGAASGAVLWLAAVQGLLVVTRLGVLFGTARAYPRRPWTYWLSPALDLPVALRLIQRAAQRRHSWRGRRYVDIGEGRFVLEAPRRELEP